MPMPVLDITGVRYGRTVALSRTAKGRVSFWLCQCDCGKAHTTRLAELRNGRTVSCGCASTDRAKVMSLTHGRHGTPEYKTWLSMRGRCYTPQNASFKNYGAKGITVCDRWRNDFAAFYADMGPKPFPRASLDRKDNNGDYEPGNCRWATPKQQTRNRSITKHFTVEGKVVTLTEAIEMAGNVASYDLVYWRLSKGWPLEKALHTPTRPMRDHPRLIRCRKDQDAADLLAGV